MERNGKYIGLNHKKDIVVSLFINKFLCSFSGLNQELRGVPKDRKASTIY